LLRERKDDVPFLRAAGDQRVVDTSTNWTAGSFPLPSPLHPPLLVSLPYPLTSPLFPSILSSLVLIPQRSIGFKAAYTSHVDIAYPLIIPEKGSNNTLSDHMCPSAGSAKDADATWLATYSPPILRRLNAAAPGADLVAEDVYNLMSMCGFDSVWRESMSRFCGIFRGGEWELYEYGGDIDKFYKTGYVLLLPFLPIPIQFRF
jgi:hypothetical protein